jgi:hypothetical protein
MTEYGWKWHENGIVINKKNLATNNTHFHKKREENVVYDHSIFEPVDASMYIYSTVSFDNFKQGISILHVTNATIIFEIVSDRLAPVEYKRSGCMLTPLLI